MQRRSLRRAAAAATVAAVAVAGAAPASAQGLLRHGGFRKSPTESEVLASWPAAAKARGVAGWAAAVCEADQKGALSACRVLDETPAGEGFGAALLQLAPQFRARPHSTVCARFFNLMVIHAAWPPEDRMAKWRWNPRMERRGHYFPEQAEKDTVYGAAVLRCRVPSQGSLRDCRMLIERPEGHGFGEAALRMAHELSVVTQGPDEVDRPMYIQVPVNFTPNKTICY